MVSFIFHLGYLFLNLADIVVTHYPYFTNPLPTLMLIKVHLCQAPSLSGTTYRMMLLWPIHLPLLNYSLHHFSYNIFSYNIFTTTSYCNLGTYLD